MYLKKRPALAALAGLGAVLLIPALAAAQPGATPPAGPPAGEPSPQPYPPQPYPPQPYPPQPYPPQPYPPQSYPPQPYPPPPNQPPPSSPWSTFHPRYGLTLGASLGLGGITAKSGPLRCDGCNYEPLAGAFDLHIGGMLSPRLSLLGEFGFAIRQIDESGLNSFYEVSFLGGAQFWVLPVLWVKGGLGIATVGLQYDRGYVVQDKALDTGGMLMAAVGAEVFSTPHFAIDLQLRGTAASFKGLKDQIYAGMFQVGFSWF
jgi:hypothetical protein